MSTTKIFINKPVVVDAAPVDEFQLEISFMHGDADFYETQVERFLPEHHGKHMEDVLFCWVSRCHTDEHEPSDIADDLRCKASAIGIDEKIIDTVLDDLPWDKTSGYSHRCRVDGLTLYYYDKQGIKHHAGATVFVDGVRRQIV